MKISLIILVLIQFQFISKAFGQSSDSPNIIFIIADDLNQFVGAYGEYEEVKTPNLDLLASKGTLFTNAHSNAQVCAPSRASLFTVFIRINLKIQALKTGEIMMFCVIQKRLWSIFGIMAIKRPV